MVKFPLMRFLFKLARWMTDIAALYLGFLAFRGGQHVLHTWAANMGMPWLSTLIHILFGIAGIFALVDLLMDLMSPKGHY